MDTRDQSRQSAHTAQQEDRWVESEDLINRFMVFQIDFLGWSFSLIRDIFIWLDN